MLSNLSAGDVVLIVVFVVAAVVAGLYFLNRWASKRISDQNQVIEKTKQTISAYIIDKKMAKAAEGNLPKAVVEQLPRWYKLRKMPLVKAKIGPQILTLMCDKKVFKRLPVKKNVKIVVAGIYIVEMKGAKGETVTVEKKKPWYSFLNRS